LQSGFFSDKASGKSMAGRPALAEDERLRIIKRTHEGRQLARDKGVKIDGC
jgi:hypothetical protein